MSAATVEDCENVRKDSDDKANQNSNPEPIPFYVPHGRRFYGFGKSEIILQFRQFAVQHRQQQTPVEQ
jgi:hypothetical protein